MLLPFICVTEKEWVNILNFENALRLIYYFQEAAINIQPSSLDNESGKQHIASHSLQSLT